MNVATALNLPGHRERKIAQLLHEWHLSNQSPPPSPPNPIRVVCISDTHNTRPELPPGDILIHAGDLTETGSFDEIQRELDWLSSQPHAHKLLIAGNHDVLLDPAFLSSHPERRYGSTNSHHDLNFGSVIYLQDTSTTLTFSSPAPSGPSSTNPRTLTILGSPRTPRYGLSAFQYPPSSPPWHDLFSSLPRSPDIVITHGPPKHHLDKRDFYRAGCPYLAEEIARAKPKLVVFGHIHAGYGREDVVLDGVQRLWEEVVTGWRGWDGVLVMAGLVLWGKARGLVPGLRGRREERTVFVNAAVVGGNGNQLSNEAIVVEL
ncbi:hypothetical protein CAC42_6480 [Sphaceloma murrayae]|uniref:Calcineurin-like phosphoesterase domain-containing protein n=1 Tax=Sphaceloma murrayae TaxID=2082308 RepID=A0A2K1QFP5_9PEZI|nr:hypothetical protein CAC42_6480 [Sphaceloma murrayae]